MKYFAILGDSFREAAATKILYVMVGLWAIVLVLLASISFRQLTMEEEVQGVSQTLNFALGQRGQGFEFEIRDFKQTNDAENPWEGDYEFKHVMRIPEGTSFGNRMVVDALNMHEKVIEGAYWYLKTDKVKTIKAPQGKKNERWLQVTAQGTNIKRRVDWLHKPELFFGSLPLPAVFHRSLTGSIHWVETNLVTWIGAALIILVGIIATSAFIPNMLARGHLDLLLSKPVSRSWLLIFKYLGGLTFVFLLTFLTTTGIWLILGIRSGIWAPGLLWTSLPLTFFFAILYSVSTLMAVLTRSAVVCILVTCAAWLLLWLIGWGYNQAFPVVQSSSPNASGNAGFGNPTQAKSEKQEVEEGKPRPRNERTEDTDWPKWFRKTLKGLYWTLPRTDDLDKLTDDLVSQSLLSVPEQKAKDVYKAPVATWWETVPHALAFIVVMLGLACWRFSTRDY